MVCISDSNLLVNEALATISVSSDLWRFMATIQFRVYLSGSLEESPRPHNEVYYHNTKSLIECLAYINTSQYPRNTRLIWDCVNYV